MIGAGNVATHLAKALFRAGHDILQVYSHTAANARRLAVEVGAAATDSLAALTTDGDVYIFSVKDSVLAELIPTVCKGRERAVMLHTAGSVPLSVFEGMAWHYGVLYPMQTFSKQRDVNFAEVPCFTETNDEAAETCLRELTVSLGCQTHALSSADRVYLHLSAVWACNFVNHCYAVASDILARHDIPFSVMLPLIDETARKVHELTPHDAQTGPAVRYDENVIRAQAALLKGNPLLRDLYDRMSISIHKLNQTSLS